MWFKRKKRVCTHDGYIPTSAQYEFCLSRADLFRTPDEREAQGMLIYAYSFREKIRANFINIVNQKIRVSKQHNEATLNRVT